MQDRDADLQRLSDRRSHYATVAEITKDFEARAKELVRLAVQARDERDAARHFHTNEWKDRQQATADAERWRERAEALEGVVRRLADVLGSGRWTDPYGSSGYGYFDAKELDPLIRQATSLSKDNAPAQGLTAEQAWEEWDEQIRQDVERLGVAEVLRRLGGGARGGEAGLTLTEEERVVLVRHLAGVDWADPLMVSARAKLAAGGEG